MDSENDPNQDFSHISNWRLIKIAAERLAGETRQNTFTRGDIINYINNVLLQASDEHRNPDSLNPCIQGVTVNARGGAPGCTNKNLFYRVSRGTYSLFSPSVHGRHLIEQYLEPLMNATRALGGDRAFIRLRRIREKTGEIYPEVRGIRDEVLDAIINYHTINMRARFGDKSWMFPIEGFERAPWLSNPTFLRGNRGEYRLLSEEELSVFHRLQEGGNQIIWQPEYNIEDLWADQDREEQSGVGPVTIESLLDKYRTDLNQIDALYQWASIPTFATAGWGLEENYPYITNNLKERYDLSHGESQELTDKLRRDCRLLLEERELSDDLRDEIRAKIEDKFGEHLCSRTIERLENSSTSVKGLVYVLFQLRDSLLSNHRYTKFSFTESGMNELSAQFYAAFTSKPLLESLVQIGIANKLLWITTAGKRHIEYLIPMYLDEMFSNIPTYIEIPPLPDVNSYIKKLFEERSYDQLRILDDLLQNKGLMKQSSLHGNIIPMERIVEICHEWAAISPLVYQKLEENLAGEKTRHIQEIREKLKQFLEELRTREYPRFNFLIERDKSFRVEYVDSPDLHIYIAPWISIDLISKMKDQDFSIVVVIHQSIPSLQRLFRDTNMGEQNMTILCIHEGQTYPIIYGEKHPLTDQFTNRFINEESVCPNCGTPWRKFVKYCGKCGTKIN